MPRFATPPKPWRGGAALRDARTCYDHLAGRLGVALAEALARDGHVTLAPGHAELTPSGRRFLADRGIALVPGKRPICRACLDWSERRPHLAGALGAALAAHALEKNWVQRIPGHRAVMMTPAGRAGFITDFGFAAGE